MSRARVVLASAFIVAAGWFGGVAPHASAGVRIVDVEPSEGPVGTAVHVTGEGCPPGGGLEGGAEIIFTVVTGGARSQLVNSNPDGSFSFDYVVLPPQAGGQTPDNTYKVTLTCDTNKDDEYSAPDFTLTGPKVVLAPAAPSPGGDLEVTGFGCVHDPSGPSDGTVSLPDLGVSQPLVATDSNGYSVTLTLPSDAPSHGVVEVTCLSQLRNGPAGPGGKMLTTRVNYPFVDSTGVLPAPAVPLPNSGGGLAQPGAEVPGTPTGVENGKHNPAGYVAGRKVRSALAAAVRTPAELPLDATRVLVSALIAVALLLVVFPAELFNKTLEEHYDEVVGWLPWRHQQATDASTTETASTSPFTRESLTVFGLVAVAAAVLYSLVDPHAGFDRATITAVIGVALAIVVSTLVTSIPARRWVTQHYDSAPRLRAFPAALVVTVVCVLVSRTMQFTPGYIYGVVAGFTSAAVVSKRDEGRAEVVTLGSTLLVAYTAWLLRIPVASRATHGGIGWLVLDTLLAALFAGGLGGLIFSLVPLHSLPGSKLFQWDKRVWAGLFGSSTFMFVLTLLQPSKGPGGAVWVTVALFCAFGAVSVGFWAYFRYREPTSAGPGEVVEAGSAI